MYNFSKSGPIKRYGRVTRGWKLAKIYKSLVKNSIFQSSGQYIKTDFEMLEKEFIDILVPAFFSFPKYGKADPKFLSMGEAAGLSKDYGEDLKEVFNDLQGRELMVFVVHKYKKGRIRRDRVVNFKPLPEPGSSG